MVSARTVTALFADIKGSMELIEDLDPEEARAIIDPALQIMIEAVGHFGGYVVQSTGDGIFALFGAPAAHEDHPQRALYAALRLQEQMRSYADQLRGQGHPPIQARVGVNTGEVVVRTIKTGDGNTEYTPIGHSTSLASRLQTVATPGSTVISGYTRGFVEGYFQLKALGPTRVKGASEPVEVFEVTGLGPLRTRLQRAAGRGFTYALKAGQAGVPFHPFGMPALVEGRASVRPFFRGVSQSEYHLDIAERGVGVIGPENSIVEASSVHVRRPAPRLGSKTHIG